MRSKNRLRLRRRLSPSPWSARGTLRSDGGAGRGTYDGARLPARGRLLGGSCNSSGWDRSSGRFRRRPKLRHQQKGVRRTTDQQAQGNRNPEARSGARPRRLLGRPPRHRTPELFRGLAVLSLPLEPPKGIENRAQESRPPSRLPPSTGAP
jgi:hypothetical protein